MIFIHSIYFFNFSLLLFHCSILPNMNVSFCRWVAVGGVIGPVASVHFVGGPVRRAVVGEDMVATFEDL